MNLKSLTDEQLWIATDKMVENERRITADVIKHLFEINQRKLFLARGFDSLFTLLVTKYRYCKATAMLRLNAVRLMHDVPEVVEKIESGEMPVTVVANIQSFLNSEASIQRPYSREAKIELVETCIGKSVLEVQREFVRRNPEVEQRESVRYISEERVRVSHNISNALEEKLQRIKMLWSHVDPSMSRENLINRMAEITLDQIDPIRKAARALKRKEKKATTLFDIKGDRSDNIAADRSCGFSKKSDAGEPGTHVERHRPTIGPVRVPEPNNKLSDKGPSARTRYIKAVDNHAVFENYDGLGCTFIDVRTGKRCSSQFQLQRDHFHTPWSHGGPNSTENLRILCANHNRWAWASESGSHVRCVQLAYG